MAAAITDAPRETVARLRHLRTSPTKVRPVLQLIAGQDVMTARDTLRLSDRAITREISKLLDSAVANAEHNDNIPEDELYVARAFADEGPTLKRWRPRARGRGTRIRKRTTHLTIVVARLDEDRLEQRRQAEVGGRGPRRIGRRRPAAPVEDHDHEHDHEHDHDEEGDEGAAPVAKKTAKKATKKTAKKAGPEKSTAKKATKSTKSTKKAAEKSTTKKSTAKKTSAKKTAKKATKKSTGDTGDREQDS